ncbi:MAG: redoxin family protein [Saprospiraceae bacterium]|nr:redoxin family protein [Saprospiraceae bacterium]MCB9323397.1 redoxin family protein [Lewinellaceae bacterium]
MKKIILITLAVVLVLKTNAQPLAPDFTVVDSDGVTHKLYADYLNQGKTVVIDLFFTYCPPCIALAPYVEPLYESWGSGTGDVEFIALSIQNDDSSADVAQFKIDHNMAYPGVGVDGGAIPAVQPFYSGDWGPFEGVPTFVVIAPDGTVNFDPSGPNQTATIAAIEQAIRQTGARKPFDLSGTVMMPGGTSIGSFDLVIDGEPYTPDEIGAGGLFGLNVLMRPDSVYQVGVVKNGNYNNGLTTFDLIKIRKQILGIDTFDAPWKYLAADANHSSSVSTSDLIQLTKLVLAISDNLPNNDSWGFIKSDYLFSAPGNPYPEEYSGNASTYQYVAGSNFPLDFTGFKIGDLNESADPD